MRRAIFTTLCVSLLLASAARAAEPEGRAPVAHAQESPVIGWGYQLEGFDPPAWRRQHGHLLLRLAGAALRHSQPTSFYLRWSAPLAVLVDKHVAVELVPSVWLLYRTPTGAVTPLWQLSLAFSWRDLGRPMMLVRSPAPDSYQ